MDSVNTHAADARKPHPILDEAAAWLNMANWQDGIPVPSRADIDAQFSKGRPGLDLLCQVGFALPCKEMIVAVQRALTREHDTGKLLEVGAGTGYMSAIFRNAGVEVTATDMRPSPLPHIPTQQMFAVDAVLAYPDHAVLMSWPEPHYLLGAPSAVGMEVLRNLKPGNLLIYIHGDAKAPYYNEPFLLKAMQNSCTLIDEVILPRLPDEGNVLRIFKKHEL